MFMAIQPHCKEISILKWRFLAWVFQVNKTVFCFMPTWNIIKMWCPQHLCIFLLFYNLHISFSTTLSFKHYYFLRWNFTNVYLHLLVYFDFGVMILKSGMEFTITVGTLGEHSNTPISIWIQVYNTYFTHTGEKES